MTGISPHQIRITKEYRGHHNYWSTLPETIPLQEYATIMIVTFMKETNLWFSKKLANQSDPIACLQGLKKETFFSAYTVVETTESPVTTYPATDRAEVISHSLAEQVRRALTLREKYHCINEHIAGKVGCGLVPCIPAGSCTISESNDQQNEVIN